MTKEKLLRMPMPLYERMKNAAESMGIPLNALICIILSEWNNERKEKHENRDLSDQP